MQLANVLCLALADVSAQLRLEFPDVFRRVDAIKAEPSWRPHQHDHDAGRVPQAALECAWCGEFFAPAKPGRAQVCCSNSCRGDFQAWRRRRSAA